LAGSAHVNGLGLKGDVGLKAAGWLKRLSASIGFGISGKYAVVLSRDSDAEQIAISIFTECPLAAACRRIR